MDPNLLLIFGFVLVVGTIALMGGMMIHRRTVIHEERKLELRPEIERAKAAQSDRQLQDFSLIEDRLRVLERIATDRSGDLSAEIESLRERKQGESA